MESNKKNNTEEIENKEEYDETMDELDYDEESASKSLNSIYEKTKEITEFQHLYDLAAACMFSTDREIGLAVLFSYDYFHLFINVLQNVLHEKNVLQNVLHENVLQNVPIQKISEIKSYKDLLQVLSR
jgi:hypothetical protein